MRGPGPRCDPPAPEGDESAARWLVQAHQMGWRHLVAYNWRGGRFAACGFGPDSQGTRVDLYGDVGDYAGSGLDGAEVHLHGDGQDQIGQILKSGKLVVHGDVGQTFLYGAKGGEIYVLGSAAGRPLINTVGRPRAVTSSGSLTATPILFSPKSSARNLIDGRIAFPPPAGRPPARETTAGEQAMFSP